MFGRTFAKGLAGLIAALMAAATAGELNPSAPPTSGTMKPLDQVEPRTAVCAANTPGDGSYAYVISQPGSYYLVWDVIVTVNKGGIRIAADHVTLDLMGFRVENTFVGPKVADGIAITGGTRKNIVIKNGTIRAFRYGIFNSSVSDADIQILGVTVLNNVGYGICLNTSIADSGGGIIVRDCIAEDNGMTGILVGNSAKVECCTANRNQTGIAAGEGGIIRGCNTSYNAQVGIVAGENNLVENNVSSRNGQSGITANSTSTIRGNSVFSNGDYGIFAGYGSVVTDNTARSNQNHGIRAYSACVLSGNTCSNNQTSGIFVIAGSTVVRNSAYMNQQNGIYASGCLVDQNTCVNNNQIGSSYVNLYTSGCTLGINHAP
ncbi:MAG TPA: right-handed parallel beta-helix repeat-containing protein [Anaerohalosphaeraceae bacterium]|nr:right-handed parallel beta-helix repeat-containing protein [Anaerohalosphaeraceae bacterium]